MLLILAGVAIATLTGENGVLTKASTAKEEHQIAQYKEEINLIIAEEITERKTSKKEETMIISLKQKIEKKDWIAKTTIEKIEGDSKEYLIVESKEGYEFIIEVDNEKETAKIIGESKTAGEKYTITYEPNGGVGTSKTTQVRSGFYITLEENTFTKEGYTFGGWCEKQEPDEGTKRYLEGDKYQPTGNITLYAIWKERPLTADDITSSPEKFYGATVSGYSCPNDDAVHGWKIFYAGTMGNETESHIYLIADDYISSTYAPKGKKGSSLLVR